VADVPSGLSLTPPHETKKKLNSLWVPGLVSQEVKRQGRETDHSSPCSEVKNGGNIPPRPVCLPVMVLN
jgi:hypothetical protein